MTLTGLECPIDGLPLTAVANVVILGNGSRDRGMGEHVHIRFDPVVEVGCLSGHKWVIVSDLLLRRTA